jgi:hypothetical protein
MFPRAFNVCKSGKEKCVEMGVDPCLDADAIGFGV